MPSYFATDEARCVVFSFGSRRLNIKYSIYKCAPPSPSVIPKNYFLEKKNSAYLKQKHYKRLYTKMFSIKQSIFQNFFQKKKIKRIKKLLFHFSAEMFNFYDF